MQLHVVSAMKPKELSNKFLENLKSHRRKHHRQLFDKIMRQVRSSVDDEDIDIIHDNHIDRDDMKLCQTIIS